MTEVFVSPFEDDVEVGIALPKPMTCEDIEATYISRRDTMTQAERDAEDQAAEDHEAEMFDRWAEATAAASFGLTISEYREERETPPYPMTFFGHLAVGQVFAMPNRLRGCRYVKSHSEEKFSNGKGMMRIYSDERGVPEGLPFECDPNQPVWLPENTPPGV